MASNRKKFASQLDAELLDKLRAAARREGRHLQALLDEAVRDYLERRESAEPRPRVMAEFRASIERNRRLGELLSK